MRRVDPLFLLTLLGLVGAGALAALHPTEPFDPTQAHAQRGRTVQIDLEVLSADHRGDWQSGRAAPVDHPHHVVDWVWFRPPEQQAHAGDRIVGTAMVEEDVDGTGLVLSGPTQATLIPGPHPVPMRWRDLQAAPEAQLGRLLILNAAIRDGRLVDPTGTHSCPLDDASVSAGTDRLLVRVVRPAGPLGWTCIVEGAAP